MSDNDMMGEVVDIGGAPPAGFTLDAEASRKHPVVPGIIQRAVEPEPDEIDVEFGFDGDVDDDRTIDDPARVVVHV